MCVNESGEGEDMVGCAIVRHESNLTFMQDIVLIEELNYTGVDDAAEQLAHTAADTYPSVILRVKSVSTFKYRCNKTIIPTLRKISHTQN